MILMHTYWKRWNNIFHQFSYLLFALLFISLCFGCNERKADCRNAFIEIENRWNNENGGLANLEINNEKDRLFICQWINSFSNGAHIMVSNNCGYLTIFFNNEKMDMIFTVDNGVVFNSGIGKYVYDEELTQRIMSLMKISKPCWGDRCH